MLLKLALAAVVLGVVYASQDFTLHDLLKATAHKRPAGFAGKHEEAPFPVHFPGECPPWSPFQCPDNDCIPIKYLCDGSEDCKSGYDEDERMCTAAVRPPVSDTSNFLTALLSSHGKDFLAKIFGAKAKDEAKSIGGVNTLAVTLSEEPTAEEFGRKIGMSTAEVAKMKGIFGAIAKGEETNELTPAETNDFRFFAEQLLETGF